MIGISTQTGFCSSCKISNSGRVQTRLLMGSLYPSFSSGKLCLLLEFVSIRLDEKIPKAAADVLQMKESACHTLGVLLSVSQTLIRM